MAEKVTVMVLKVDLQCPCCYKKVKKILCIFPQIRDQVFDEKANKVTITVVCCNPEKIRDKLCCKGAKVIKSIEIVEKRKLEPEKPTGKPTVPPVTPPPEKQTKTTPTLPPEKPPELPPARPVQGGCPPRTCCGSCYAGYDGGPCYHGYGVPPPPQPCYGGYCGHGWVCHVTRCDYYLREENPQACSIM